jgi:hypothetical protein
MKRLKRSLIYILFFAVILAISVAGRFLLVILLPVLLFVLNLVYSYKFYKEKFLIIDIFFTHIIIGFLLILFLAAFRYNYFFESVHLSSQKDILFELYRNYSFIPINLFVLFLYFSIIYFVTIRIKK